MSTFKAITGFNKPKETTIASDKKVYGLAIYSDPEEGWRTYFGSIDYVLGVYHGHGYYADNSDTMLQNIFYELDDDLKLISVITSIALNAKQNARIGNSKHNSVLHDITYVDPENAIPFQQKF